MKLQHAIVAIVAWATLDAFGAVYNSAPKVDSIADLTNRVVSTSTTMTTPYVEVARLSPSHPYWDKPRVARLDLTATNALISGAVEPTSTGVGRWIFDDCFGGGPINVKWFGAIGTNSSAIDDTSAIQSALNFATNLVKLGGQGSASAHATFGGLTVLIPSGVYFYSQIGWPSDVAVRGEGPQRTIFKRLTGQSGNATYAINGDGQRLNLADFSIDGSWMAGTNVVNTNGHGLFLARTNYPNTVDGWPTLRNIYIHNCPQSGLYVGRYELSGFAGIGGMRGAQVEGCHFFANGEYGLVVDSTDGVYRDNYYYNNGVDGVYIRASAVMNQFVGGRSYFNARHGLYAAGLQFNPIKGLSLVGFRSDQNGRTNTPGSGIFLTNVWESSLSGVIAFGNTLNGIDVHKSTDIHISGSAVEFDYGGTSDFGVQQYGVYIASTATNIVADVAISSGHSSNAVYIGNTQTSRALIREPNSIYGDLRIVGVTRAFGDLELQNDTLTNGPAIRMASVTDQPAATLFIWDQSNQRFVLVPQAGSNYVNLYVGGFGITQTNTRPTFIYGDTPQAGKATNEPAQPMYFYAPRGTGSGSTSASSYRFNTAVAGASGTALQSTVESVRIDSFASGGTTSSLLVHDGSALQRLLIGTDTAKFAYFGATSPTETIQDIIGTMAVAGANMTISYNDGAGTLTFSSTGGGGATNGSAVLVNGTYMSSVNITNSTEIAPSVSGTNLSFVLLTNGVSAGSYTNPTITIDSKGRITAAANGSAGGGGGAGTNVFVNNVLMQPAKFTNNTSSDAGRVMWYTNAAGDILAYATNLPAGGSGSNTVVLVNNSSVTNPNFTHSTNVQAVVTAATNISFVVTNSGVTPGAYTAANITVGADGRVISAANGTVGEANTASNLGTPSATVQGLYSVKSGVDLRFRSLEAGTGITLTSNANTVVVNSSGSSSTFSTNNLGYLERSVTLVTNTESGGEVPHYTITIPGNTLGVNGDEVEIHIPGTFSAYTTGTNSAYTFRWSFDSAFGGADNVHVVNMSSNYFTQTSTEYSLDWKLRIKRIDSNTVVTSSEHFAGPHVDSGSTNNLVSSLGTMWIDFNGDLGTDPADFTIYTDIIDDTRAARLKTFGYLVAKVGSGSGSGGGIPISVNATNFPTAFNLQDQSGATKVKTSGGTNASIALSKMQVGHFTALDNQPPTNNYATFATRNAFAVLEFDPSTEESARGVFVVPEGADLSSGLTFKITWTTVATSGNGRWGVQVMRLNTDIDSDSFDTAGEATTAANATSGIPSTTTITLTTIDSIAAGEPFAVRIYRDTGDAADTIDSNDLQLMVVDISTAY